MTPKERNDLIRLAGGRFAPISSDPLGQSKPRPELQSLAAAVLELAEKADFVHPNEWPIENVCAMFDRISEQEHQVQRYIDTWRDNPDDPMRPPPPERLTEGQFRRAIAPAPDLEADAKAYHADLVRDLLPKLPTLGGMTSPQGWLRGMAHFDRLKRAHARAREAEQIADWIDSVVALASPPQDNEPAFDEVDEEETSNETAAQPDPHSRACVRDALDQIIDDGFTKFVGASVVTVRILDALQADHLARYGYRSGFIERVKVGAE